MSGGLGRWERKAVLREPRRGDALVLVIARMKVAPDVLANSRDEHALDDRVALAHLAELANRAANPELLLAQEHRRRPGPEHAEHHRRVHEAGDAQRVR